MYRQIEFPQFLRVQKCDPQDLRYFRPKRISSADDIVKCGEMRKGGRSNRALLTYRFEGHGNISSDLTQAQTDKARVFKRRSGFVLVVFCANIFWAAFSFSQVHPLDVSTIYSL